MPIVDQSHASVTIAVMFLLLSSQHLIRRNATFAQWLAIQVLGLTAFQKKNIIGSVGD